MRLHDEITALRAEVAALRHSVRNLERQGRLSASAMPLVEARVERLIIEASAAFGVPPEMILSQRRTMAVAHARQWVMYEAYALGMSSTQIGAALQRDHTSVLNGVKEEEKRRKALPDNYNLAKIKAGRNAVDAAPDPNRNRDTLEVRENGSH